MDTPRLSRRELAFVLGIPAAWGILLLFHPLGDDPDDFYATITGNEDAWLTVHVGMAVFIPLFAGAVFLVLRGVDSRAARISRIGLVLFAVLYAAYEITLGVGTGILTKEVNELSQAERAVGAELVDSYAESGIITWFTIIGSVGLAMAMVGAAVALRDAYGLAWPAVALLVISIPLIALHEPPFGPVGLAMFIAAVLILVRRRAPAPTATGAPLGQPG